MNEKKPLNLAVPVELLDEFNHVCQNYGHAKQKGMVLSAAILMFLRADPQTQGKHLEEIATAEIQDGVRQMLQRIKREQGLLVAASAAAELAAQQEQEQEQEHQADPAGDPGLRIDHDAGPDAPAEDAKRPKKAAKKAGQPVRKVTRLKSADDLKKRGKPEK